MILKCIIILLAPHQPRLDWQMWFAALGHYKNNPWLVHLVYKLLIGERDGKCSLYTVQVMHIQIFVYSIFSFTVSPAAYGHTPIF